MLSPEILKKIRHLEIHTKKLLSSSLIGDYSSARKGSGFEFDQIREYQQGDDVRFIDWKSSARMNKLLIKECIEERTRTVMLLVDTSASTSYCSAGHLKSEVIASVAGVLALVADYGKDHAGLVLFSDDVEDVVPPGCGGNHTRTILRKLFDHKQAAKKTHIKKALQHVLKLKKHDAIIFVISDFIDEGFEKELRMTAALGDVVAIRCLDDHENAMPAVGLLPVVDMETGQAGIFDTRKKAQAQHFLKQRIIAQNALFKRLGVDVVEVSGKRPFIGDIIRFFRRRMMY